MPVCPLRLGGKKETMWVLRMGVAWGLSADVEAPPGAIRQYTESADLREGPYCLRTPENRLSTPIRGGSPLLGPFLGTDPPPLSPTEVSPPVNCIHRLIHRTLFCTALTACRRPSILVTLVVQSLPSGQIQQEQADCLAAIQRRPHPDHNPSRLHRWIVGRSADRSSAGRGAELLRRGGAGG